MLVTKDVVRRMLSVSSNLIPELIKSGQLKVVKSGFKGRKWFDRDQVLELADKLKKPKEL
jgi:hypothetical protein